MFASKEPHGIKLNVQGFAIALALMSMFLAASIFANRPALNKFSIDFVICENAQMETPNGWHIPKKGIFRTNDERFYVWLELKNVSGIHPVEMRLYSPDGTFIGKEAQYVNETNGIADWWRMAAWWRINDDRPAQSPGLWKLDLVIDEELQRSLFFVIGGENPAQVAKVKAVVKPAVTASQTIPILNPAGKDDGVCVIEASSDLVHWTPIESKTYSLHLNQNTEISKEHVRLVIQDSNVGNCVVEVSPDSLNWTPIQTNDMGQSYQLDASDSGFVPARFYRAVIQ